MNEKIKYYLQHVSASGDGEGDPIDIESTWQGLLYSKFEGLENKGKRKNVYTESYADSDELRVWQGKEVTREATNVTLSLCFVGEKRQDDYEDFYNTISNGKFFYWDTKRKKKAYLILIDAYEVKEDVWVGSGPYKYVQVKFQNLWGACKPCQENGDLV